MLRGYYPVIKLYNNGSKLNESWTSYWRCTTYYAYGRTNIGLEVIEEIRKYFKDKVFNTIIPRLVRLVEAPSHGKPINEYDPESRGAEAYHNLAKEVIERDGN